MNTPTTLQSILRFSSALLCLTASFAVASSSQNVSGTSVFGASSTTSTSSTSVTSGSAAPAAKPSAPHFDLYSETTYVESQENFVNQSRLTYRLLELGQLAFYAGAAVDQDSRSDQTTIYNDNHVAPLAGARYTLGALGLPVGVFAEYRHAIRLTHRPVQRTVQEPFVKAGIFNYGWIDLKKAFGATAFTPFVEHYGEAVYTSKVEADGALSLWAKGGARYALTRNLSADAYAEAVAKRSTLDYPAENLQEFGPGARFNASLGRISASASARRGFGGINNWTGLLVIAGEI